MVLSFSDLVYLMRRPKESDHSFLVGCEYQDLIVYALQHISPSIATQAP